MKLSQIENARLRAVYGQWAVITGASSGIGLELARQVAKAGINIVLIARSEGKLQAIAKELTEANGIATRVVAVDVSAPGWLQLILDVARGLPVGLLILAAGFGTSGGFVNNAIEQEANMLRVNCEAILVLAHHFAKRFADQRRGGIIFLSSIVAFQGVPHAAHYAATKAYVQTLTEGLAAELKPLGVDVLAAAPGPVASGFESRSNMKMTKTLQPEEIGVPILRALGKQHTVFPGTITKLFVAGLRTVPRWGKIKIMQKVMAGMTQHQQGTKNKVTYVSP